MVEKDGNYSDDDLNQIKKAINTNPDADINHFRTKSRLSQDVIA